MRCKAWLACVLVLGSSAFALADATTNPWSAFKTASQGEPRSIGDYSAGCVQGAHALPLRGKGYQVMHPSRMRYFGHPQLIAFVQTLGRAVQREKLGVMLLGDLSQPRGGRASGGHASHQSGLDIDIWFWHPKRAERTPLSTEETESLKARTVVDAKNGVIEAEWKSWVTHVLRLTVADARVERIFVHPIIKRELCALPAEDRAWLHKLRPWHGHDDHFHVRLACPKDSPECTPQEAVGPGDGCDELDFWFSKEKRAEREQAQKAYQSKVITSRKWPTECDALLKNTAAPP
jgi:penicillin-insensitive murein endopeptidase